MDTRDLISISLEDAHDYSTALHTLAELVRRRAEMEHGDKAVRTKSVAAEWLTKARRLDRIAYERAFAAVERGDIVDKGQLEKYKHIIEGAKTTRIA